MAGAFLGYTLEIDEVVERLDIGEVAEFDFRADTVAINEEMPVFND